MLKVTLLPRFARTRALPLASTGGARLGLLAIAYAATAGASEPVSVVTPVAAAPSRATCSVGERSALDETACELARALGPLGRGVVVAVGAVRSDRPLRADRRSELSTRIARALARVIGGRPIDGASTEASARALSYSAEVVVFVAPEIAQGELRLVADARAVTRGFWDRVRNPSPAPMAHAFASRRLDGEIGSFLPPVPLVSSHVDRVPSPTTDVVALACGDVDEDGSLELVVVGRYEILVGRLRGGRFATAAKNEWSALSPVAPSPLREPIGGAVVGTGYVDVGITDRASGLRLSPALAPLEPLAAPLPWARAGCLARVAIAVGNVRPCVAGERSPVDLGQAKDLDAFAGGTGTESNGRAWTALAYRDAHDRTVTLLDDEGHVTRTSGLGAALAVGDLNLDGRPDLAWSLDTLDPTRDALVVGSWSGDRVVERFRLPVPEGVRAVAACPNDGGAMAPIAVATTKSLWIVR